MEVDKAINQDSNVNFLDEQTRLPPFPGFSDELNENWDQCGRKLYGLLQKKWENETNFHSRV